MLNLLSADPQALCAALPPDVQVERVIGEVVVASGPSEALIAAARLPGVLAAASHDREFDEALRGPATRGEGRAKIVAWAEDLAGYVRLLSVLENLAVTPSRLSLHGLSITAWLSASDQSALRDGGFGLEAPLPVRIPRPVH